MNLSKISLALNIVLAMAVIYLFFAVQSLQNNTSSGQVLTSAANTKIDLPSNLVFINIDSVDAQLDMVKDMRKEMEAERKRSEASLKSKYKDLEQEFIKAQEDSKYFTQDQAAKKQNELMMKEQNLMKMEQDLGEALANKEAEKNKDLQKRVHQALQDLQKTNPYSFVFGYNGWGNLIYANDSMDITKEVVNYLNKNYSKK